ncbi:hypothetical protein HC928_19415 [bacterium]|nr:hypothetical protein [bacterium]
MFTTYVDWQLDRAQQRTSYSRTQILQQLHWLSRRMQDHNQSIFRIEELQPTWLGEGGARLFAAAYSALCMLLGALLWVATTPLTGNAPFWERVILPLLVSGLHGVLMWWGFTNTRVPYDRWWIAVIFGLPALLPTLIVSQEVSGSVFNAVIFGLLYSVMAYVLRSLGYRPDTIHVVERLQFSIQHVRWGGALLGGLAIGGFAIFSLAPFVFPGRLPLAAAVGFMISSSAVGLTTGLTSANINANMRVNQGIYNSARNALMVGLGNAIGVFMVFATVNLILNESAALGVYLGLYSAVFFFVLIAFVVGFAPVIQHLVLRVLMHRQWNVPWNYAAFLEHAARMALLKRVGGGYIFIHRYLLEYFAALRSEKENP